MGGSFVAPVSKIEQQASYVNGVHNTASTADDAGNQVKSQNLDMAYGILCQIFPQMLQPIEHRTIDTIEKVNQALVKTVDALHATADSYRRTDEQIDASMQDISSELDGGQQPPIVAGGHGGQGGA